MKKTEAEYKRDSGSLGKCKFKKKTFKKRKGKIRQIDNKYNKVLRLLLDTLNFVVNWT